jgi:hypothetical protein
VTGLSGKKYWSTGKIAMIKPISIGARYTQIDEITWPVPNNKSIERKMSSSPILPAQSSRNQGNGPRRAGVV